jgi:hypothetical protein
MSKTAAQAADMVSGFQAPLSLTTAKFSYRAMSALLAVSNTMMARAKDITTLKKPMFSATVMESEGKGLMRDLEPPVENVVHTVTFALGIVTAGDTKFNRAACPDADAIYGTEGLSFIIEDLQAEGSPALNNIQIGEFTIVDDFTTKFTVNVLRA